MSPWFQTWCDQFLGLLWPRSCLFCLAPLAPAAINEICLCPNCLQSITTDKELSCPKCAATVGPHTDVLSGCLECRGQGFRFRAAIRFGRYQGALREMVLRLKQPGGEIFAESLGRHWAKEKLQQFQELAPNVIVPVPLHWRRRWERGFNQSEALAHGIASVIKVPLLRWSLRRIRHTPRQSGFGRAARRNNVKGCFVLGHFPRIQNMRVLLVDDVMTTGATMDASSRILLEFGAAQVDVAILAHR